MVLNQLIELTQEARSKEIKGVIELGHLLEKDDTLELNPELFFKRTYLTDSIKEILEHIQKKIQKKTKFGSFSISGNYGSGKSHILLALYHYLNSPEFTNDWLKNYNAIELVNIENYKPIIVPLNFINPKNLWEPIFEQLETKYLIEDIRNYPTIPQIKQALSGRSVVIFFDEIEKWYQSIENISVRTQNKFFIQNLLHIANENESTTLVFISLLLEGTDLEDVINRENTLHFDLYKEKEKKEIIRFRLIEKIINKKIMKEIIKKYLDFYYDSEYSSMFNNGKKLINKKEMEIGFIESFPFHPLMLETLIEKYQKRQKYGNVRGLLYLLASILTKQTLKRSNLLESTDLILLSDVDLYQDDILTLNRSLVNYCRSDYERIKKRSPEKNYLTQRLLSSCLIHSINEEPQDYSTISDLLLAISKPESKISLNEIKNEMLELSSICPHFHHINGTFAICRDINPEAEISIRMESISNFSAINLIKTKIKEIFKKDKNSLVSILEDNELEALDNRNLKFIILLNPQMSNWATLRRFIKDKIYQNSFIFIIPKVNNSIDDSINLRILAKRILIEDELTQELDKNSPKLKTIKVIRNTDEKSLISNIIESYGHWLRYKDQDTFNQRRIEEFDDTSLLKQIQSDLGIVQSKIKEVVFERKHTGIKLKILKDDFYRIRGYPIIIDLAIIDKIVLENCKKKEFILKNSHARLYYGNTPKYLNDDFFIFHKDFKDVPRYTCRKCQLEYDTEELLEKHKREYHPEFTCPQCSQIFEYATELQGHIEIEHIVRKYKCEFCDATFKEESQLFDHVKKHHEIPKFHCPICNNSFNSGIDLQEHITEMHESFECKICGKKLKTQEDLSEHIKQLHDMPEFICKECGSSFSKAEELQFHKINEHPEPIICHFCEERFPSLDQLNKHIINVHELAPAEETVQIIENLSISSLLAKIENCINESDIITYLGLKIIFNITEEALKQILPEIGFSISEPSSVTLNYELNTIASPSEISSFIQKLPFRKGKYSLSLNIRRN